MMPFLFALFSLTTYFGTIWKLGAFLLLIEVVCLNNFYGVVFAPGEIGWTAAGSFGGCVIAFGVLVLFDNWLWPDPAEANLMESLATSLARTRSRLLQASSCYLDNHSVARPPFPPPTSALPVHMTLLDQAIAEGVSEHRRAILLAVVTRVARIGLEVDRLIITAREDAPEEIRTMLRPEIEATVEAIAATLDQIARELPTHIAVGLNERSSESRLHARAAMDVLSARMIQLRPVYIATASSAEMENTGSFIDSLAVLTRHIEHLIDEPPQPPARVASDIAVSRSTQAPDPAVVRYSLKVGLCVVAGFMVGITTQRGDLYTILITVLITALPTYGAALNKIILRIVGATIGGVIALLAIIIISPNFEDLVAYLLAAFTVFYLSAYCALASGRFAYVGRQIGVTFAIALAALAPAIDVYEPLWRIWGILLGTFVVAIVAFYCGRNTQVSPYCLGCVESSAIRSRWRPAVRLRTMRKRFSELTRMPCSYSPKFWRSPVTRKLRAATARSITTRSSRPPAYSATLRTAWLQYPQGASSFPCLPSIRRPSRYARRPRLRFAGSSSPGSTSLAAMKASTLAPLRQSREATLLKNCESRSNSSAHGLPRKSSLGFSLGQSSSA